MSSNGSGVRLGLPPRSRAEAEPDSHDRVEPLENGERTDRRTFHEWYLTTPEGFKAELIGGEVYVASPVLAKHWRTDGAMNVWLGNYSFMTPGTDWGPNGTIVLADDSEPQPDSFLFILPENGGRIKLENDYVVGAPELIGETGRTRGSIELHRKKTAYEKAGVMEYIVALTQEPAFLWFVLRNGKFEELTVDADGIYRSTVFPGLWLDPDALLNRKGKRLLQVLNLGIADPVHAAFVADLAERTKAMVQSVDRPVVEQ